MKQGEKFYIQVANDISESKTFEREINPLLQIKEAYPKLLIAAPGSQSISMRESVSLMPPNGSSKPFPKNDGVSNLGNRTEQ